MPSDEERLVNGKSAVEDGREAAQILDAAHIASNASSTAADAASNTNTTEHADNHSIQSTESTTAQPRKRWFILEPAVFLLFIGVYLTGAVYQNQLLYQSCVNVFHRNATECEPLLGVSRESEEAKHLELEVQPYVSRIIMARSLLESIIPAFVSLFIGPWSDKFGRRPIILATYTGYLTGYIALTFLAFLSTKVAISPWFYLLGSVPSVLSGGTCALITGIYCYISDVAQTKARAMRMVLNESSLCAGMMVGNIASGYIYAATDVVTIFFISSILMGLALLYVYIFVVESLKPEQIHAGSKIREFFRLELVSDLVRTSVKRRPNYDRAIIWLVMTSLTIAIFTMEGESNVLYLFVRSKFGWTQKDFSLFNASRIIIQIFGSIVGLIFLKRVLKFSIITMTMLAYACSVLESTIRATAMYSWEMYLGIVFGFMRGIMGPMSRAILSHVAPATEVGKIYALTTSMESVSPLGAAPLYTSVYNITLEFYPGLFYFISAGLYLFCFTLITTIFGIQKSLGSTATYQAIGS